MNRKLTLSMVFLSVLTTIGAPSGARSVPEGEHSWCGTDGYHSGLLEGEVIHEWFEKRRAESAKESSRLGVASVARRAPNVHKEGVVAVIDDDGFVVASRNLFDFSNKSIKFFKKKNKLRAKKISAGINPNFGSRIEDGEWGDCATTIAPVDDDSKRLDLPFRVKFYGTKYDAVFVNSDGNLTFGTPDCASSERGLTRVINGPPRILPFFGDLDPAVTSGERGIFVNQRRNNVQITWNQVPQFGSSDSNTFQITLFKSGKINVVFGAVDAPGSIVGASPGGGSAAEIVDFSKELPVSATKLAILERYSELNLVDRFGVVEAFLDHFKDIYSQIILWTDFPSDIAGFANASVIKNDVSGLGLPSFDATEIVGSNGVVEGLVQMGELWRYPRDVNFKFLGTNSTLDVLGQEVGHRWLARARVQLDGVSSEEILGRDVAHWSFFMDSDESDMEGNDIMDLGGGSFETVGATSRFSALDQYFMGLVPPEAVGPQFFVRGPSTSLQPESAPQIGVQFTGTRVDFTVDDIIAEEGPRVPNAAAAPKTFNMAFILVSAEGEPASSTAIGRITNIARAWADYFHAGTDGNGSVKINLKTRKK